MIREGAGTQFDPDVVQHFLRVVMPYPVGYTITMPDGGSGVVASVDPDDAECPVLRFRGPAGDLIERHLRIVDGMIDADEDHEMFALGQPATGKPWTKGQPALPTRPTSFQRITTTARRESQ